MRLIWRLLPFSLLPVSAAAAEEPPFDQRLAAKYGLTIAPVQPEVGPAPAWLQHADMFTHGSYLWQDYQFQLKATPMTRIVRHRAGHQKMELIDYHPVETVRGLDGSAIRGTSLISHAPHSQEAFRLAHAQGFRVIPYVHFMCLHINYADQDVFYHQHP